MKFYEQCVSQKAVIKNVGLFEMNSSVANPIFAENVLAGTVFEK